MPSAQLALGPDAMLKCEYQTRTNVGMIIFNVAEVVVTGGNHLIQITNEDH